MRKKQLMMIIGAVVSAAIAFQQGYAEKNVSQKTAKKNYSRQNDEYRSALKTLWTRVYPSTGETLYCGQKFSTKNYKERKKHVNAEHIFPMSWVTKDLQCGTRKQCQQNSAEFRQIESDLHNIYPALINVNKARSNYRFGEVAGEKREFGKRCDFEVNQRGRIAEPTPAVRGEIARAMLYLAHQYGLSLHKKTEKLMKTWDRQDPPSQEEKRRAKIIQREQGRENPFITRYPFSG